MNLPHPFQNVAYVVRSCVPSINDFSTLDPGGFQDLFELTLSDFLNSQNNNITDSGLKYLRTLNQSSAVGSIIDSYYEVVDEEKDPNFDPNKLRTFLITRIKVPLMCKVCGRTSNTHLINKSELRFKNLHIYDRAELLAENGTPCPICRESAIDQYLINVMQPLQQFEKDRSFLPFQNSVKLNLSDFRKTQMLLERNSRKIKVDHQIMVELNAYNSDALPLVDSAKEHLYEFMFLYERQLVKIASARYGRNGEVYLFFDIRSAIALDINSIGDTSTLVEMVIDHSWSLCQEFVERMLPHSNIEYSLEYIETIRELLADTCPAHLNVLFFWSEKDFLFDKTRFEKFKLLNILKSSLRKKLELIVAYPNKYPPEKYVNYFEIRDHHLAFLRLILPGQSILTYKLMTPNDIKDALCEESLSEETDLSDQSSLLDPSDMGQASDVRS